MTLPSSFSRSASRLDKATWSIPHRKPLISRPVQCPPAWDGPRWPRHSGMADLLKLTGAVIFVHAPLVARFFTNKGLHGLPGVCTTQMLVASWCGWQMTSSVFHPQGALAISTGLVHLPPADAAAAIIDGKGSADGDKFMPLLLILNEHHP